MQTLEISHSRGDQGQIANSLNLLLIEHEEKANEIERISDYVGNRRELMNYFLTGNNTRSYIARDIFAEKGAKAALDAEYWQKAMNQTDVLSCMPAKDRNEWTNMIHEFKTPKFERNTVVSTLHGLLADRSTFFAKKVDGVFHRLSDVHVTNSPMGFKKRLIIGFVVDVTKYDGGAWYHPNYRICEYIQDLQDIINKLLNREESKQRRMESAIRHIADLELFGEWHVFDGGSFRLKLFKKGTAHIEIHEEVAVKLNRILATLHGNAIPAKHRTPKRKYKESPDLKSELIGEDVCLILSDCIRDLHRTRTTRFSGYDKSSRKFVEAGKILKALGGEGDGSYWEFDYDPSRILSKVVRSRQFPNLKSYQFYPTPLALADKVQRLAAIDEEDRVLEPSAGIGSLVAGVESDLVTCVEKSELFSDVLLEKGFTVINDDFINSNELDGKFSKILMNPPFSKGQAISHVKRASELMANFGRLVAILPASLKDKEIVSGKSHEYSEVIESAFIDSGTAVNVVLLVLE